MHIAICDDQPQDRKLVADTLKTIAFNLHTEFDILEFDNQQSLLETINQTTIDAVLLDIDMPNQDGITIANTLGRQYPMLPILFVTNYDNLVFEAIKSSPFRFIRKTFLQEELLEAMNALLTKLANEMILLELKNGSSTSKCPILNIIFIESNRHYLDIYTIQENYHIRGKLSDYDKKLADYGFIRIHVSYLVNVRYIYQISSKGVILDNKKFLPVSRDRIDEIKLQYTRQSERFIHGIYL